MTAKQWLERAKGINREIEELREEKERAFVAAMGVVRPSDGEKVHTSKTNSQEKLMINYASYSAELDRRMAELYGVKAEIVKAIESVDKPIYRDLLMMRYIKMYSWGRIAREMHYSDNHVYKIHKRALKKIYEILKMDSK